MLPRTGYAIPAVGTQALKFGTLVLVAWKGGRFYTGKVYQDCGEYITVTFPELVRHAGFYRYKRHNVLIWNNEGNTDVEVGSTVFARWEGSEEEGVYFEAVVEHISENNTAHLVWKVDRTLARIPIKNCIQRLLQPPVQHPVSAPQPLQPPLVQSMSRAPQLQPQAIVQAQAPLQQPHVNQLQQPFQTSQEHLMQAQQRLSLQIQQLQQTMFAQMQTMQQIQAFGQAPALGTGGGQQPGFGMNPNPLATAFAQAPPK